VYPLNGLIGVLMKEQKMPNKLPVALITGAAKRVGADIARALHADNFDIALHYRGSESEAMALQTELNDKRAQSVEIFQCDLKQLDAIPDLCTRIREHFGRVDALINNASSFYPTPMGEITSKIYSPATHLRLCCWRRLWKQICAHPRVASAILWTFMLIAL
jgi:NAD(P)-dependent dehydrogenase (short-subunit alcohol dehydrogenase family)